MYIYIYIYRDIDIDTDTDIDIDICVCVYIYIYIAILYSKYQTSESRGAPRGRSPRPHHSTARHKHGSERPPTASPAMAPGHGVDSGW